MSEIDFNKLIKDIISAARGEAIADQNRMMPFNDDNKLSITLKLEVTINKNSSQIDQHIHKSSRKLVLLSIADRE